MDVLSDFLWLLLGLGLLYVGAEWLVKGAKEISLKLGISPLVVGLTVVAFGTSAPELVVSLQANLENPPKGDLALGNIVGSNICNIALILGIGALIRPIVVHLQIVKREMPILLVISGGFLWVLRDGEIARWEGAILFAGVILYTVANFWQARIESKSAILEVFGSTEIVAAKEADAGRIIMDVGLIVVGMTALVFGANRLVFGGSNIASYFGVSEADIALTVVAFGTSLPELATSVVAAIRRQGDLIIGNAVGSCIFNILCVVGLTSLVKPLSRTPELQSADLWIMFALTVTVFPFMWSRRRLSRVEGGILFVFYLSYIGYLAVR
ncbi:MAG: calcium/sodium antiporter [Roseibacillus sp.]